MPKVAFTRALERFVKAPTMTVEGATLGEALDKVFQAYPALRGYVLDDQGAVREHVAIYLNGVVVRDRAKLSDRVGPTDEIYVFQALTGG
jgi:sulfur-carrier protein